MNLHAGRWDGQAFRNYLADFLAIWNPTLREGCCSSRSPLRLLRPLREGPVLSISSLEASNSLYYTHSSFATLTMNVR